MARIGTVGGSSRPLNQQFLDWTRVVVGTGVNCNTEQIPGIGAPYAKFKGDGSGSAGGTYFRFIPSPALGKIVLRITCEWKRGFVPNSNAAIVEFRSSSGTTLYYAFNALTAGQRSMTLRDNTTNRNPFSGGVSYDRGNLCTFWCVWKRATSAGANDGYGGLFGHIVNRSPIYELADNDDHNVEHIRVGYIASSTNPNGEFYIHEVDIWDDAPIDDLSLIHATAGRKFFHQCPLVVKVEGAAAGQTPSSLTYGGVDDIEYTGLPLAIVRGVRTDSTGATDATLLEHRVFDNTLFNTGDVYDGYFLRSLIGPTQDLPISQIFWHRKEASNYSAYCGSTAYLASSAATKKGTLTTRTDDSSGELTLESGHGVTTASTQSLYWFESGVWKARRSVTIGTVSGDVVPFSGGTGDNLPAQTSIMYVAYIASDYRSPPQGFEVRNWVEVSPGTYIFGIPPNLQFGPGSTFDGNTLQFKVTINGVVHTVNAPLEPYYANTLQTTFPNGRAFAFGFDDSLLSAASAWRDCFSQRANKAFLAVIVGLSGTGNQISWEGLRILRRDGWSHHSHLWNASALSTMVKAVGLKLMEISGQILRCQEYDNTFFVAPQGQKSSSDDPDITDEMMERCLVIRLSATSPVNNFPIDYENFRGESVTNVTITAATPELEAEGWWVARLAAPVAADAKAFMVAQGHEIGTTESSSFMSVDHINAYLNWAKANNIDLVSLEDYLFVGIPAFETGVAKIDPVWIRRNH